MDFLHVFLPAPFFLSTQDGFGGFETFSVGIYSALCRTNKFQLVWRVGIFQSVSVFNASSVFRCFAFWSIPPIFFQVFAVIAQRLSFTVVLFSESFFVRIFSISIFCANFLNLLLGWLSKLLYSPLILKIMTFFYSEFFYFVFFVVFCSGRIFVVLLGFTVFCFGVYTHSYWFEATWNWEILKNHIFHDFVMFCRLGCK